MQEADIQEPERTPTEARRLRNFSLFFKNYMSISSVVTAALPIPVTSFGLIPTFTAYTKLYSTYTSLFCFLLLGFIFYSRHLLARIMFPEYFGRKYGLPFTRIVYKLWSYFIIVLPVILIAGSVACILIYDMFLNDAINITRNNLVTFEIISEQEIVTISYKEILEITNLDLIPNKLWLIGLYLGIFITAEAAFILMAIKEYLQDLVGLKEIDLIKGPDIEKWEAKQS